MKRISLLCLFTLLLSFVSVTAANIDSLLLVLDKAISERGLYEQHKLQRIALIKEELQRPGLQDEQRYHINNTLYDEYEAYICDSAIHYADENLRIATRLGNKRWIHRAMLNKTHLLAVAGLYSEARELLDSLSRETLQGEELTDYYVNNENICLYQAEYAIGRHYVSSYLKRANSYRDSILAIVPTGSYRHTITYAPLMIDKGEGEKAIELLEAYLPNLSPDTRQYAITTSILAFAYYTDQNREKEKEFRIRSAIADMRAVVKENYSLGALSELLYADGQIERANRYIKVSMEDASVYTTRLRSLQSSKMLPLIDRAYQQEKEIQQQKLKNLTLGIGLLSLFLLLAVVHVIRQMRKLSMAQRALKQANRSLQELNEELKSLNNGLTQANLSQQDTNQSLCEANRIKEEYLGRFLSQCSGYIDKLEEYRRMLNKHAAAGKLEELYRALKSNSFANNELKEFYHSFDASFLRIFPNFIEDFNRLLPPEEQIVPKNNELLSTELRIFALIRLGITDSSRIAGFLRYSITTIYTYRSKLKKKALCKEEFEEQVMQIKSY